MLTGGCASHAHREDLGNQAVAPAPVPPPVDLAAQARAEEIAREVAAKAKRSGKAARKHGRVKDDVRVTNDGQGHPVVEQAGEASWYGKRHRGKKTASGAHFDENKPTAAHPSLPLGTKAKVTNLDTGKSADLIINDRGPYAKGRDIDLSKNAADKIGVKDGTAPVKIDAAVPSPTPGAGDRK